MVSNNVFEVIERTKMPEGAKTINSTCAYKNKSSGKLRGRLNAWGFKQIDGQHFDGSSIHAPVTNAATIRILLVLMCLADGEASVVWKELFCMANFRTERKSTWRFPKIGKIITPIMQF